MVAEALFLPAGLLPEKLFRHGGSAGAFPADDDEAAEASLVGVSGAAGASLALEVAEDDRLEALEDALSTPM